MKRVVWAAILAGMVSASIISCSSAKFPIQDGYYSAEAAEFDHFGWKEYITICVSSGQIILVEYNAFNSSGFLKSWDMNLMRVMNATDGTYPNAFMRHFGGMFLENQGIQGINILSGATYSYYSFLKLAEAALESARLGKTETIQVDL